MEPEPSKIYLETGNGNKEQLNNRNIQIDKENHMILKSHNEKNRKYIIYQYNCVNYFNENVKETICIMYCFCYCYMNFSSFNDIQHKQ